MLGGILVRHTNDLDQAMKTHDPLTYTYPRTWAEVISRHPCTGDESVAIERYAAPMAERVADYALAGVLACALLVGALAYFGVLAP
jgi:hypothetical protein